MLPRLIEFLFFLFILYLFFRRLGVPFLRGYDARERERREETHRRPNQEPPKPQQRIDRTQVEDAEFKDLD
jgi:hypothetical protein